MALRKRPAALRQLKKIQTQLCEARGEAGIEQGVVAERLKVRGRTLRDWERSYDSPSTPHLIEWAREYGCRLVFVDSERKFTLPPVSLKDGESFVEHEVRRLVAPMKARRNETGLSRADASILVGVSRTSMQCWEDGEQTPMAIVLIGWGLLFRLRLKLELDKDLRELVERERAERIQVFHPPTRRATPAKALAASAEARDAITTILSPARNVGIQPLRKQYKRERGDIKGFDTALRSLVDDGSVIETIEVATRHYELSSAEEYRRSSFTSGHTEKEKK